MAYHRHHTVTFNNTLNEGLFIELYKKDVEPEEETALLATGFKCAYQKGDGDKFDSILSLEATLTLWLQDADSVEFDDFIVTFPDEWKVIAYNDDQIVFIGFLTPGQGKSEFQDKPYEVTLSATDGLGLLKAIPLTNNAGERFLEVNLFIDYVLAILKKTDLGLDIRVYSNITEESMQDRSLNEEADTFNQSGLHARTFLKDSIEFYDCYKALEIILTEYFSLYQWNGKWVILRIGEMQENPGAKIWYTEYDSDGNITSAAQSNENAAAVGRDHEVHPTSLDQSIGSEFAVKSVRYSYDYVPWPELPTNNNFERGAMRSETVNDDGTTTRIYDIDDWDFGGFLFGGDIADLPALDTSLLDGTSDAYKKIVFNQYGVELSREIYVGGENSGTNRNKVLQSDPVPVNEGDKVEITFDFKKTFDADGNFQFAAVYIKPDAGTWPANRWTLENNNSTEQDGGPLFWRPANITFNILGRHYLNGVENVGEWHTVTLDVPSIPATGQMYFWFWAGNPGADNFSVYRNFKFTYRPFVGGGYLQVRGDYAQTEQDTGLKDRIELDVFVSDSLKKVLKGAIYRADLQSLTTPTWHRFNVSESRHFKELGEIVRFNNTYRRMWNIGGSFDGVKYKPVDNPLIIEPLSFHRHFTFPDTGKLDGRYFMLVPPLNIDYVDGSAGLNFVEVLHEGSADGNELGDTHTPLKYIFD